MTTLNQPRSVIRVLGEALLVLLTSTAAAQEWQELPTEWQGLAEASPEELGAILSEPDHVIRLREMTVIGYHPVSLWEVARRYLTQEGAAGLPVLQNLLRSEQETTQINGLTVLCNLRTFESSGIRSRLIELLGRSPSSTIRSLSARALAGQKSGVVVDALLDALRRAERQVEGRARDEEIQACVAALCRIGKPEERIIPVVAALIEEKRSSTTVVWTTMQASSALSRSVLHGRLLERYWMILSTTRDDGLPYIATSAMKDDDPRTLPFLRQCLGISRDANRRYAVAELVGHASFDPADELFGRMLRDASVLVQQAALTSLAGRRDVDPRFRMKTFLEVLEHDDVTVGLTAVDGVFRVLRVLPADERQRLLTDPDLSIGRRILAKLDAPAFRTAIIFQTGQMQGQEWKDDAVEVTRDWWKKHSRN